MDITVEVLDLEAYGRGLQKSKEKLFLAQDFTTGKLSINHGDRLMTLSDILSLMKCVSRHLSQMLHQNKDLNQGKGRYRVQGTWGRAQGKVYRN